STPWSSRTPCSDTRSGCSVGRDGRFACDGSTARYCSNVRPRSASPPGGRPPPGDTLLPIEGVGEATFPDWRWGGLVAESARSPTAGEGLTQVAPTASALA